MSRKFGNKKFQIISVLVILILLVPVTQAQEIDYGLLWDYETYDYVYDVAMSSDGSYIAVGSGTVLYFFDWNGYLLWSYDTYDYVTDVAIAYDSSYIAAVSGSALYYLSWTGELLEIQTVWDYEIDDYTYDSQTTYDGLYVTADEFGLYLSNWDGESLWDYFTDGNVNDASISSDGLYIVAGDENGVVYFFSNIEPTIYQDSLGGGTQVENPNLLFTPTPMTTLDPYIPESYWSIWDFIGFIFILFIFYLIYRGIQNHRNRPKSPRVEPVHIDPEDPKEPESQSPSGFSPPPTTPSTFPPELKPMYSDVEYLGKGGFSRVFKAKRVNNGRFVAIKIPISLDETTGKSFLKEIKAWEGLNHPNVIELYDLNIMPLPYFEMEYVGGGSLEEIKKPIDVEKAARIIFDISEGLKYAHKRGIIHRDLKPHNVLLTEEMVPKITDWGLSKVMAESKTSSVLGFSPVYAAPEQISPNQFGRTDQRTDIWQLGIIFYELVSGKLPFTGESVAEIGQAIINESPLPPSKLNPDAIEVEKIILKCLEKKMDVRYRSVEEIQKEIAEYLKTGYKKSMMKSSKKGDISRSRLFCSDLVLMSAGLGDYKEALKYLFIMKDYVGGAREKADIENLINEIKFRLSEDMAPGEGLLEKIKLLVYRVKMTQNES